jgi:hypothetical protein
MTIVTFAGWGQTANPGGSATRSTSTDPRFSLPASSAQSITQTPVRATTFPTNHATTPSEPPVDVETPDGAAATAMPGPTPMQRATPWLIGLAIAGGVFAYTRRK